MYSYEERKRAVNLYLKLGSARGVIKILKYPSSKNTIKSWVKEFKENDDLKKKSKRNPRYSKEKQKIAIDYYLANGRNVLKTVRDLGYPGRTTMYQWVEEQAFDKNKSRVPRKTMVYLSNHNKKEAVIDLCEKTMTSKKIANKYNVNRTSIYKWKKKIFGDRKIPPMQKRNNLDVNIKSLASKSRNLEEKLKYMQDKYDKLAKDTYRMRLEYDALETATKILKKGQGITLIQLANKDKAIVIDALKNKYRLKELLSVFKMAKSSYFYQKTVISGPDKYKKQRKLIKNIFLESKCTYGYRRVYSVLRNNAITLSEKVIIRLMKEEKLVVKFIKRKKYSSYMGEISPSVSNLIKRDFHSDKPNVKWLTDITEFHIPAGKIYLSPIIDCFDGLPVAWTIGTHPNAELVNTMLDTAIKTLNEDEKPIIHSDRGAHYRWPGWINRMKKFNLKRSMSKKGCSPDNSACEGFFGRLKNEMFYGNSWENVSIDEFIDTLDNYIRWYSEKRIKLSLGGMSPLDYRKSLGFYVA